MSNTLNSNNTTILFGAKKSQLLRLFFDQEEKNFYQNEIGFLLQWRIGHLQYHLKRLVQIGIIKEQIGSYRHYYYLNQQSSLYEPIKKILKLKNIT